jgi:hypothetical protein
VPCWLTCRACAVLADVSCLCAVLADVSCLCCRKRRAKAARAACLDPNYLSADTLDKSRHTVPMYEPADCPDLYSKECQYLHHHSTDTLDGGGHHKQMHAVEYTPDGRCTATTCMPPSAAAPPPSSGPPPYPTPRTASRLYESPKVSL